MLTAATAEATDQERTDQEGWPLCRECGLPMMLTAEKLVGIHVRCVWALETKNTVTVRSPKYGKTA
jgi:hypothetical protein